MATQAAGWIRACLLAPLAVTTALAAASAGPDFGGFDGQSDVGNIAPAGTARFEPSTDTYTLTAAGANTWYHVDAFHYLWKKASGDWALTADIDFPPPIYHHSPDPHRKGILMFRQTLDAGAVYAGLGAHGSGMTALQYRRERGANTQDIELNIDAPKTVRIEKRGDTFTLYVSARGEPLHPVGASASLHLESPFYLGLGVVSHDAQTTDTVRFSHVSLVPLTGPKATAPVLYSTLQILQVEDQFRRAMVIRSVPGYLQSPNWIPDGKTLTVLEDGHLERIALRDPPAGGTPRALDVGTLVDCAGNHGASPDGQWLAVSCAKSPHGRHDVYVLPAGGGTPRKLTTAEESSYFHAWSADSATIAFTRGSAGQADIFTIAATGGTESRLTHDTLNDGPDFSPDGRWIYFDSSRSGSTQIWRMQPGTAPEQLTDDDDRNSSPHVSPDGKTLVYLSQPHNAGPGIGKAALKLMDFHDGLIRTLVDFDGDRGSLAMSPWGDANHLAFVSYQRLDP